MVNQCDFYNWGRFSQENWPLRHLNERKKEETEKIRPIYRGFFAISTVKIKTNRRRKQTENSLAWRIFQRSARDWKTLSVSCHFIPSNWEKGQEREFSLWTPKPNLHRFEPQHRSFRFDKRSILVQSKRIENRHVRSQLYRGFKFVQASFCTICLVLFVHWTRTWKRSEQMKAATKGISIETKLV